MAQSSPGILKKKVFFSGRKKDIEVNHKLKNHWGKNAQILVAMTDSALSDATVVLSSTVCFHPVLSINSKIRACLFFRYMFSISSHKQLLLSGSTQKQREAVSRDMIKPRKHPTLHPLNDYTTPLHNERHITKEKKNLWVWALPGKLSSHFLLLLLILSMCLSFYCNLQYA